ncbi:MAG: 50S ribosomal protein L22 [Candidatus Peregrinibacteria bacterium]
MHASLTSTRIAPKKLNVIAKMVRGMPTPKALTALEHTHKKAARIIEGVLKSAIANATFNDKQRSDDLYIKTIVVNQASSYRRGVPMARGRVRPMRKFLSHLDIVLGLIDEEKSGSEKKLTKPELSKAPTTPKRVENASQPAKKQVQRSAPKEKKAKQ